MRTPLVASAAVGALLLSLTACSKSTAGGGTVCPNGAAYCFNPASPESDISAAFASAKDGDVISFAAGTYTFTNQLALGSASNVTVVGAGVQTIFDFSKQLAAEDSIFAQSPTANLTLKSFAVKDSPGNAIKVLGVKGLTFDSLTVTWTGADPSAHGAYGLYPVQSSNVLIQNCSVSGASDSGIYVGQSQNVVVQKNECFQNVAGIEIENTYGADVHANNSHDNTAGILVFGLPGLQQEGGHNVRVYANTIANNNTKNFAAKGDIVSIVPAGTGFFVMACSNVEVYGNTLSGNGTVATAAISYFVSQLPVSDPKYYPYSSDVYFHDNTFSGNGTAPDLTSPLGLLMDTGFNVFPAMHTPDVVYDGILACPLGGASDAGTSGDAGGCGLPPVVVGPSANPFSICAKEPNASAVCNLHLDQLKATNSNLPAIVDCDAGYLSCTLPALTGVPPFGGD
jgi:parallel beta-helix repeat protein